MVRTVVGYVCQGCYEFHQLLDSAEQCCPPEREIKYMCDVCGIEYCQKNLANKCCEGIQYYPDGDKDD